MNAKNSGRLNIALWFSFTNILFLGKIILPQLSDIKNKNGNFVRNIAKKTVTKFQVFLGRIARCEAFGEVESPGSVFPNKDLKYNTIQNQTNNQDSLQPVSSHKDNIE